MDILFRVVKSLVMAAIMMGSAWVLTGSARIAVVASLVPFVLGMTNIMAGVAYGLTAVVFLSAIALQVVGEDTLVEMKVKAEELLHDVKIDRRGSKPPEPKAIQEPDKATK